MESQNIHASFPIRTHKCFVVSRDGINPHGKFIEVEFRDLGEKASKAERFQWYFIDVDNSCRNTCYFVSMKNQEWELEAADGTRITISTKNKEVRYGIKIYKIL